MCRWALGLSGVGSSGVVVVGEALLEISDLGHGAGHQRTCFDLGHAVLDATVLLDGAVETGSGSEREGAKSERNKLLHEGGLSLCHRSVTGHIYIMMNYKCNAPSRSDGAVCYLFRTDSVFEVVPSKGFSQMLGFI